MHISVALCTYNGEEYLKEQLDSIANQTVSVNEIVICDDGSKDKTGEIIECFSKEFPHIAVRFVKNPVNLGYTKNFEQAITLCSGDIIFLSDQDDTWMPYKVETFCNYFSENPDKEFVFSNATLVNPYGFNSFSQTLFDVVGLDNANKQLFNNGYAMELLLTSGRVTGSTSAIKASFVPYCFPFLPLSVKPIHDEILAVSAAACGKIGYIDECLINYKQHAGQSVGISLLFKYPPKHWELAGGFRPWSIEMLDGKTHPDVKKRMEFIRQRFWALRSTSSFFRILFYFFSGKYQKHYDKPFDVFLWDFKGVFVRLAYSLKCLWRKKIVFVEKYSWNG